jgi:NADPH:quinone reductase-like Zn-dependent oxidoreductase
VQIAKSFGARVAGVCSSRNLELVRSIGADHVIDYTEENFTRGSERYDLIFQLAGTVSPSDRRRALTRKEDWYSAVVTPRDGSSGLSTALSKPGCCLRS